MKLKSIKNKKGISPLFVSIYLVIIVAVLLSLLFAALSTYESSLTTRMRIEQERRQESIRLIGPKALNMSEGTYAGYLRVNNTGSITVRIRALYVGDKYVCDPSKDLGAGDSYIDPKEALWISLYPHVHIELNSTTLNALWTVTTERGIKTSEIGAKLIWGEPPLWWPKKFYIGPLMLMFDMFHWSATPATGPWNHGWSIPQGNQEITWRILVVNIEDKPILLNEKSCLVLISNDNSPKDPKTWYIDPLLMGSMTLLPGDFNFIYYTWKAPFSHHGGKDAFHQGITGLSTDDTCLNFLCFYGSFVESDGTLTSYGQTIPFEAVQIT